MGLRERFKKGRHMFREVTAQRTRGWGFRGGRLWEARAWGKPEEDELFTAG